jgi:hypothetical protein
LSKGEASREISPQRAQRNAEAPRKNYLGVLGEDSAVSAVKRFKHKGTKDTKKAVVDTRLRVLCAFVFKNL